MQWGEHGVDPRLLLPPQEGTGLGEGRVHLLRSGLEDPRLHLVVGLALAGRLALERPVHA